MPTTVYDASLVTQRKRNNAIYTWNRINQENVNAGLSVLREQPNTQLATVVTYRHETAANTNPAPSADCPCTSSVNDNKGGNVSNNVQ